MNYTTYWKNLVESSNRSSEVPSSDVASHYLEDLLESKRFSRGIDIGAGFGRLFSTVQTFATELYALEPDSEGVRRCRELQYADVFQGESHEIPVKDSWLDLAVCWAVFDMCEQRGTLRELARVLSEGGVAIITGKSYAYSPNDVSGLNAEKAARKNGFKQHFVKVPEFLRAAQQLGLDCDRLLVFKARGHMAQGNHEELAPSRIQSAPPFYEFVAKFSRSSLHHDAMSLPSFSEPISVRLFEHGAEL